MVERAIPDAWSFATPESLVRARSRAAMAALRDLCPTVDEIAGAVVGTLRDVVTSAADDPTAPALPGQPRRWRGPTIRWPRSGSTARPSASTAATAT